MDLLIIHYDLKAGGRAADVIQAQTRALNGNGEIGRIKVLAGDVHSSRRIEGAEVISFSPMNRLDSDNGFLENRRLYRAIQQQLGAHMNRNTVIHAHNLNTGENPLLTLALRHLAGDGVTVLNHVHSFAEDHSEARGSLRQVIHDDFKQDVFDVMYPELDNYHYAVANSSDFLRLVNKGVAPTRIHRLPSPIAPDAPPRDHGYALKESLAAAGDVDWSLPVFGCPATAADDNNLGELALLAALFPERANFVAAPATRAEHERDNLNRWRRFCAENGVRLRFAPDGQHCLGDLLAATDRCVTTSLQEGSSHRFLTPWLHGRALVGRNIPRLTGDMLELGMELPGMYERLRVPRKGELRDFPELTRREQMELVADVARNELSAATLLELNPELGRLFEDIPMTSIRHNATLIAAEHSMERFGERLGDAYAKLRRSAEPALA